MSLIVENLLFIRALLAHIDRLQALLGKDWPTLRDRLIELLTRLAQAKDKDQMLMAVDDIIAAGLESAAVPLVRALLNQASDKAGHIDNITRSVHVTDPTSGQTRAVEVVAPSVEVSSVRAADVITAGQALAEGLRQKTGGKPQAPQPHVLYINLWIEDEQGHMLPQPAVLIKGDSYIFLVAIESWSREEAAVSEVFIEPPELQTSPETKVIIELLCPFLEAANEMGYVRHEVTYRQGSGFPPQKFILKPNAVGRFYLTARLLVDRETIYREVLALQVEEDTP
jgi:hypothetical protein